MTSPPADRDDMRQPLRIYAVGDVHGCADLLDGLLNHIEADAALRSSASTALVMMGDYIDRGPRPDAVLDRLCAIQSSKILHVRFLCGNHDDALLRFLADETLGPIWCDYGGRQTLMAYGITPPPPRSDGETWRRTQTALREAIPPRHLQFLQGLENSVSLGGYFFAHAGARPGTPLAEQAREDLLWIRDSFLTDERPFEQVVVHGHTPAPEPYSDARRIGIDTGAYATGVLTAVRLDGAARAFLSARRTGEGVRVAA